MSAAHIRAMAAAVVRQLDDAYPREEIDLDAVRVLALAAAEAQPAAVKESLTPQAAAPAAPAQAPDALNAELLAAVELWRNLYRRAVNEANGLTNYVEDRPELRRAERNLTAIEAEARALAAKAEAAQ